MKIAPAVATATPPAGDEAFCKAHGLPWTPLHGAEPHGHDHGHAHGPGHHHHHHDGGHKHAPHALLYKPAEPQLVKFAPVTPAADDHHHHPYPYADHPLGPVTLPKVPGKLAQREHGKD